jgi:transcriptional regulator of met regulon
MSDKRKITPEDARDQRRQEINAFAEIMHAAQLPEPFAGAVLDAVRGWSQASDAALWAEVRADYLRAEADAAHDEVERITNADMTHPIVAQVVERVTQRAMSKVIAIMARDAEVSEIVMASTIAALTGQPVPPAQQAAVWDLLANAANTMTADHPTEEQSA